MRRLISAALVSLMTINGSYASEPTPFPYQHDRGWDGYYYGLNFGWAEADYNHTFNIAGHYNDAPGDIFNYDGDGGFIGLHVGRNWQVREFLLGLDFSIAKGFLKSDNPISPFFAGVDNWNSEVEWFGSITPRIGAIISNHMIAYIKGGWAFGQVRDYVEDGFDYAENSSFRSGWTLGAGIEYKLGGGWLGGIGYNYYDLGSKTIIEDAVVFPVNGGGTVPPGTNHDLDVKIHAIEMRLSKEF